MARVTDEFTLQGAAAWNSSEQTNSPALLVNNPAAPDYGKPITKACNLFLLRLLAQVQNPYGTVGSPSADAPPLQFTVHARYEWHFKDYVPYIQAGAFHTAHFFTQAGCKSDLQPRRSREYLAGTVRGSGVHDLRRRDRCLEGCLAFRGDLREPEQLEREYLHQLAAVHYGAGAAQTEGDHRYVRVPVLKT